MERDGREAAPGGGCGERSTGQTLIALLGRRTGRGMWREINGTNPDCPPPPHREAAAPGGGCGERSTGQTLIALLGRRTGRGMWREINGTTGQTLTLLGRRDKP